MNAVYTARSTHNFSTVGWTTVRTSTLYTGDLVGTCVHRLCHIIPGTAVLSSRTGTGTAGSDVHSSMSNTLNLVPVQLSR